MGQKVSTKMSHNCLVNRPSVSPTDSVDLPGHNRTKGILLITMKPVGSQTVSQSTG